MQFPHRGWTATHSNPRCRNFHARLQSRPKDAVYCLAGLCTAGRLVILAVTASPAVAPCHDRMPVILSPEHVGPWLSHGQPPAGDSHPLFVPFDDPLVVSVFHKFPA